MGGEVIVPERGRDPATCAGVGEESASSSLPSPPLPPRTPGPSPSFRRRCFAVFASLHLHPKRILAISALLILILLPLGYGGVRLWALCHFRAGQSELESYPPP